MLTPPKFVYMSLKELTMQQHRDAERQKFAGVLMSGKISKKIYLRYLVNQHACYSAIENTSFSLPNKKLERSENITKDINELKLDLKLESSDNLSNMLTESTHEYVDCVQKISSENDFIAHVYVRYLGDLRGGQMIAKKVPGSGCYYQFEDADNLAKDIYSKLNDDMAEEAKKVFRFATRLFIEMYDSMSFDK